MSPSTVFALALSSLPLLVAAAADNTTMSDNMITFFGPTELDSQVSSNFLDCVNATGSDYGMYVEDNGGAVVVPMDQRSVDLDNTDAALMQCIEAANDAMYLSAESTVVTSASDKGAVALAAVSYDWLLSQGASGKQAMGTRPAATSLRSKRTGDATQTYSAYLDTSGKGCANHDHHTYEEKECHGVRQMYKSVRFENTHGGSLHMEIWPHHDCKQGDQKSFAISGKMVGDCYDRDTYSWNGHY